MAATGAWFVVTAFTAAELSMLLPFVTGNDSDGVALSGWVLASAVVLAALFGLGRGKLWAVRLFRWVSYLDLALFVPILGMAIYLFLAAAPQQQDPLAHGLAITIFVGAAIKLIGLVIIFRALARVRWLDPASLPHEWEPSMMASGSR